MLTDELIGERPLGRAGLAGWYAEVFQAQAAEGLSAAGLATRLEVSPANIYYWRRRLRELDASEKGETRTRGGLVRVEVQRHSIEPRAGDEGVDLEVRLSNRRSIVVPPGFDQANLRQLVMALEAC